MPARSFRVGRADDHEFLAIEAFGLAPETPVLRRVGRIGSFGDDAFPYLNTCFLQHIDFASNLAKFAKTWHYAPKNEYSCFTLAFEPL